MAPTYFYNLIPPDNPSFLSWGLCHGCIHQPAPPGMLAHMNACAGELGGQVLPLSRLWSSDGPSVLHNMSRTSCTAQHVANLLFCKAFHQPSVLHSIAPTFCLRLTCIIRPLPRAASRGFERFFKGFRSFFEVCIHLDSMQLQYAVTHATSQQDDAFCL